MGTNLNDRWDWIQKGVKETERMIGQRDYNMAMTKARQTLEFMVSQLISLSGFAFDAPDLHAQIDILYQNQVISKTTAEHYHKIRIIGNKAIHEGDTNAYNANQAYHMLSQEVYTFAHDYRNVQRGGRSSQTARSVSGSTRQVSGSRSAQGSSRQTAGSTRQVQSSPRQSQGARRPSSGASSRRRQPQRRSGFTVYDLLKILVPILCIILLFCVVRLVKPAKDDKATTAATTTAETSAEVTTAAEPETEESTAAVVYKTTSVLNVRPQPNTTDERIGQLDAGVTVEYVRAHDEKWAVIMYNGQEAYVASEYLTTN